MVSPTFLVVLLLAKLLLSKYSSLPKLFLNYDCKSLKHYSILPYFAQHRLRYIFLLFVLCCVVAGVLIHLFMMFNPIPKAGNFNLANFIKRSSFVN